MSSTTRSKSHVSVLTSAINPLANPRGAKKLCELCQNLAYLQCTKCRVTFYCDTEHQQADWVGIHEKICQLLIPIRTAMPFHSLQADRDHHRAQILHRQEELIEISRAVAQKKLFEGKYQESLPAAQLSLRCAMDVYGPSAVQLVPAYLLLAEANVGLGSLSQAEGYLSQAEWTVMKTPECSHTVRHQLHRNLGRLYTATENLEGALLHFANDVYYASEEYGLDNIVTCGGYFLMANVFIKQEKMDIASSLYTEVASTWHSHLTKLLETHTPGSMTLEHSFDEAQQAEADQMLRAMLKVQESSPKQATAQNTLVAHSLAMLWFLGGSPDKALEFGRKALQSSQLVPDHSLTEPIQGLLQLAAERGPHLTIAS
ncbi:zinc finger MYND domain-containing protein 12 isoform X1 [Oncorhynchus nerka]|uniref:zinc finger MYND domain-containing protein 12 n=1 Tax=Oncorhynchus keta TaxID=8018 RepID=UPI0011307CC1|nr:zinc finger MYND domain-containing protein 12 isoform X1 [Oncorhynchus nerka]XP_035596752.1 zinc finger MYND domain-containing protein 12 [Oncorhynchus keta]